MDERTKPEVLEQVRELVREIANREYPLVWVGKAGMTPEELVEFQKMNAELPDYIRAEPGELVGVEGSGEEGSFRIPEVGGPRLSGLDVIMDLSGEMQGEPEAELRHEVMHVYAAKQGKVLVQVADEIEWVPKERLSDEDKAWLVGVPGVGMSQNPSVSRDVVVADLPPVVGVWIGTRTRAVPIDEVALEQVDEDLLKDLEYQAAGGTARPFVVPETPKVTAYLAEQGEYSG